MNKILTISTAYLLLLSLVLFAVAAGIALHLWGVEGAHHCEIDAPMEQAQCRAEVTP